MSSCSRVSSQKVFSLLNHNTFAVPAYAENIVTLAHISELRTIFHDIEHSGKPALMLGSGSNVLFVDDFAGTVVLNKILGIDVVHEDEFSVSVRVGAGENWHQFVLKTLDNGWFGLENLSLIPGTVGAAPVQNIGAYGVEVGNLIESVSLYNVKTQSFEEIKQQDCKFSYRDSVFKAYNGDHLTQVITHVQFKLFKEASKTYQVRLQYKALMDALSVQGIQNPSPRDISNAVIQIRQSKLPDPKVIPNAGSFFKNPIVSISQYHDLLLTYPQLVSFAYDTAHVKLAAGQLIELAGFKGLQIGSVAMYSLQALVLTNCGGATGRALWEHAQAVQMAVLRKFSVKIEPEPLILINPTAL